MKLQQQAELELLQIREQDEKQKELRAEQSKQAREEYERAEDER